MSESSMLWSVCGLPILILGWSVPVVLATWQVLAHSLSVCALVEVHIHIESWAHAS